MSATRHSAAAPFLGIKDGRLLLSVHVQPRASRNEIAGVHGDALKVRLTAPPVDSAANEALIEFLAASLGCPRRRITLVRGHRSRQKTLLIEGMDPVEATRSLGGWNRP